MGTTIRDIAKVSGVSVSTVSKALSSKYLDISEEMRSHIQKIAKELNYSPNRAAAAIVKRKTGNIAFVTQNIKNPFFAEVLEGIEAVAKDKEHIVLVCNADDDIEKENHFVQQSLCGLVDGAIVVPTEDRETAYHTTPNLGFPVVIYGSTTYKNYPYTCVHTDNKQGGFLAVEYLIQNGHRDILFIGGSQKNAIGLDRLFGYKRALEQHGIPFRDELIFQDSLRTAWGFQAVHQAYAQKMPFTAIFCGNDYIAYGAIKALNELGLSIPGDISLVGYDDVKDMSECLGLTCMRQPKMEMGRIAAEMLFTLIENGDCKLAGKEFQSELIIRRSVMNISK